MFIQWRERAYTWLPGWQISITLSRYFRIAQVGSSIYIYITFTFMHLADAFIQSDLHCIQVTFYQLLLSLGIEPMILALLAPCSTIWATGKPYFGDYVSLYQATQLCSSAVRLNLVVKHFKRCSCIQIKCGPLLHTRATISILWMKLSRVHVLTVRAQHQMEYTLKNYAFDCTHTLTYAYKNEVYFGL